MNTIRNVDDGRRLFTFYSRFTYECTTISHGGPTNNHDFTRYHTIQGNSGIQGTANCSNSLTFQAAE